MKISKKDEPLIQEYMKNKKLALKDIIVVLDMMSKKADGIEYAALTQAIEYLMQKERSE